MIIEKNVPLHHGGTKYDWHKMEVGDSFHAEISANSLRASARSYAKNHGVKFVVRTDGTGSRAWRTA